MNESNPHLSESKLLTALKSGDNLAFKQVYRQGYALVETLITRNGGMSEDAQDVFQEVLFVVVKKLSDTNFQLSCALNTYLYAIARNIWRTRLRNSKPLFEFKDTLHDVEDPAEGDTALKKIMEKRYEVISGLLGELSESCRKILTGFYHRRMSMREIAEELKVKEEGVRVQKLRCLGYLRKKVEEHPDYLNLLNDES